MGKFYDRAVINELLGSVSFEQVLDYYGYPFKGHGKNRGSQCPKCGKDHDHFKINTYKNLANCFVCSFSSNTIQFVQAVEGLGFIAAVEKLAHICNFKLPENTTKKKRNFSTSDRIMYHAVEFYKQQDTSYLVERGIKKELADDFKIGYAAGNTVLLDYLSNKGFEKKELLDSGLVVERNGKLMDFFYQCVIFPVIQSGVIVDIYGRHIGKSKIKHVYLKGEFILFNIDNVNEKRPVIYVESIINALSIISVGYSNVVAVGGASKFSKRHISLLKGKGVKSLINGFDTGDHSGAGQEGAISSGKLIEQEGIHHKVIELPKDMDINELITSHNGPTEFKKRLIQANTTEEFELRYRLSKMPTSWIESYLSERAL
ncbi:CHC2 zinc finger domain-containing protein [Niallia sp. MER 6]|uniref:CHC2 zinc finger domain-containing protein n=2 Tax=Bacillaceae TaxID=186817 RepID=UPI00203D2311|nr:CHC2 zinc finger domain-containing protein [Niallia sp. MER 6]MCM3032907.1 CHC2 zinc finger domain-containing protein [Niallia sp. MER 6]